MLAIQPSSRSSSTSKPQKCTPNLLPARLHHDGPINNVNQYWKPETDEKGTSHAYFRGRHLHGTTLPLPSNYTGAVLQITEKQLPQPRKMEEEDGEGEDGENVEVKIAEQVGVFEEVVLWGHGGVVDESQDVYARGVREWIGFAEAMHGEDDEVGEGEQGVNEEKGSMK